LQQVQARASHQQYRQQIAIAPHQWNCVEIFGVCSAIGGRINFLLLLAPCALHLSDERPEKFRLPDRPMHIAQRSRHVTLLQIPVQQRAHALRQDKRRQKILIQALAAN